MSNSNGIVKASFEKRINFTATGLLIIWIIIIVFGIFSLLSAVLLLNLPFIWDLPFENPFLYVVCIIGLYPSKRVSISLVNLIKNRRWIEPLKFIKSIFILLTFASLASILTIIFYKANNFTEFFSIFNSFTFLFSFAFLGFSLYYYRYDLPKDQSFRNPNLY